jgi:hypothetical protein
MQLGQRYWREALKYRSLSRKRVVSPNKAKQCFSPSISAISPDHRPFDFDQNSDFRISAGYGGRIQEFDVALYFTGR